MARRTLPIVTALVASATLLLSACGGGGDGSSSDKIEGAGGGSDKASPSASKTPPGQPDLALPGDLKVEFDGTNPSDKRQRAALENARNYIRALNHGITAQDPKDPAYQYYSLGNAATYAKKQITMWVDDKWTATGTDSYYRSKTDKVGTAGVLVTMCRDQSKFYGKNVDTKKVRYTKPSLEDYQEFRLLMKQPQGSEKIWKVLQIEVEGRVKECRR
ncbi:hypothetical protein ACIBKX_13390 [Streptomyces sp. NPDC050658]|uniref:hypothetical protein n=1 Tax=unclassified Streptomyces TaxID=2593676 RepID=UPI00342F0192